MKQTYSNQLADHFFDRYGGLLLAL